MAVVELGRRERSALRYILAVRCLAAFIGGAALTIFSAVAGQFPWSGSIPYAVQLLVSAVLIALPVAFASYATMRAASWRGFLSPTVVGLGCLTSRPVLTKASSGRPHGRINLKADRPPLMPNAFDRA